MKLINSHLIDRYNEKLNKKFKEYEIGYSFVIENRIIV